MEEQERVSNVLVESVRGRVWRRVGSCPGLLYRVIFKRTPLAYCGVSSLGHSGSQFGPISCTRAARFAQNHRMIAFRLTGCAKKNRESGGGIVEKWKTEIGWHMQPSLVGIQRTGLCPVLISVHLKYLWKISGTRTAFTLGFFFFLFSSTTCTWKLRAALFLLCFATGLSQNETDLRAHDRNKKKPTKQRHLIVEPGSVSLAVLHKTGIRSHYIMLPFAEHTAQWFIHTWGCVFGPTWHACTNIIYRIKRF